MTSFEPTTATIIENVYAVFNQVDPVGEFIPSGYKYSMVNGKNFPLYQMSLGILPLMLPDIYTVARAVMDCFDLKK